MFCLRIVKFTNFEKKNNQTTIERTETELYGYEQ